MILRFQLFFLIQNFWNMMPMDIILFVSWLWRVDQHAQKNMRNTIFVGLRSTTTCVPRAELYTRQLIKRQLILYDCLFQSEWNVSLSLSPHKDTFPVFWFEAICAYRAGWVRWDRPWHVKATIDHALREVWGIQWFFMVMTTAGVVDMLLVIKFHWFCNAKMNLHVLNKNL